MGQQQTSDDDQNDAALVHARSSSMRIANSALQKTSPGRPGLDGLRRALLQRLDAHRLTVARALDAEVDFAIDQREQRVVLADADVGAGMELGAALAHDDRAGRNHLAAERLHAEHLGLRIAAVPGGTAAFFLCHGSALLDLNGATQAFTALI